MTRERRQEPNILSTLLYWQNCWKEELDKQEEDEVSRVKGSTLHWQAGYKK